MQGCIGRGEAFCPSRPPSLSPATVPLTLFYMSSMFTALQKSRFPVHVLCLPSLASGRVFWFLHGQSSALTHTSVQPAGGTTDAAHNQRLALWAHCNLGSPNSSLPISEHAHVPTHTPNLLTTSPMLESICSGVRAFLFRTSVLVVTKCNCLCVCVCVHVCMK